MTQPSHTSLPITVSKQDLLGRENIVHAITKKIIDRTKQNIHCEVFGVYGKWGEGKSSVLNLVKEQLSTEKLNNKGKIKIVDFNPWLFKDQESLLLDFFRVLQNKMTSDELKKKVKQYGPLVAMGAKQLLGLLFPVVGKIDDSYIEKLFEIIPDSEVDLQSLKEEINEQIILSKEHYVIFIDDVDRLDKDELHTLFKLIKQNADFVNTTYVIAMDVDMVAKSIGNRFEDGSKEAGYSFLEKIIQYPIYLPKVQNRKMLDVFHEFITNEFNKLYYDGVSINMQPVEDVIEALIEYIFPMFDTVREMITYRNAISFILPTVYKEVHITDFAILETLKLFNKQGYEIIKRNKPLLTGKPLSINSPQDEYSNEHQRMKKLDELIIQILKVTEPIKYHHVNSMLSYLFNISNNKSFYKVDEKRLCSVRSFDNYFLYDAQEGLIWDEDIERLFYSISSANDDSLLEDMERIHHTSGYSELEYAIRQALNNFGGHHLKIKHIDKVCFALSRLGINQDRKQFTERYSLNIDIVITTIISQYFNLIEANNNADYEDVLAIIKRILNSEDIYPFHIFLITQFKFQNYRINAFQEIVNNITYTFTTRYIKQYGLESIFTLSMMPIYALFSSWKAVNKKEYEEKINKYMFSDSFDIFEFISRTVYTDPYGDNADKKQTSDSYSNFCSIFDVDKVYHLLKEKDPTTLPAETANVINYFIKRYEDETFIKISHSD